ncbi:WxL domain-containing protein [Enterococcus sp. DIV0691]|uniref:WxL domain-containing protein n=1 Tax=Enterococcus sp. DIV0691 TaxID=2774703 RepID=UPI003F233669
MKKQALLAAVALVAPVMLGTGVSAASTTAPAANANSASTTMSATFTAPTNGGTNPTPPSPTTPGGNPSQPGNTPLNPTGSFGIAYVPASFNFGSSAISGSGELNVQTTVANGRTYNVGVKNNTHSSDGWTLNANLTGDLAQKYGAKIKTQTTLNSVKVNNGNNSLTNVPTNTVTNTANYAITANQTPVMQIASNKVLAGTFDLNLGSSVTLNIPDSSTLKAGTYNGTVNWNLATVPTP